jgi:putative ABC transport system permease protein
MQVFQQDIRFALRQLRRSPGFAITAILTLALGIGATTAVFSVAYGVLIDPFPYKDVRTLATPKLCSSEWPECHWNQYSPAEFREIADKTTIFDGVIASTISQVTLTGVARPELLRGNYITTNTFSVLGVNPMLGRPSVAGDVKAGSPEVVLLSNRYWKSHFGSNPDVIGRVLTLNGRARTVIGVMPPRFLWRGGDVYLPIEMTSEKTVQGQGSFALVGRLKPGVTDAQANAELTPIFADISHGRPHGYPKDLRLGYMTFDVMYQSGLANTLYLILGAVFTLLLIACVNVSGLMLARAVSRQHEVTVRAAIGASRTRLVRSALTESLLLAVAAIPVALVLAWAGLNAILSIVPPYTIPDEAAVGMHVPVLLASMGLALFTLFIFGMAPAWHSANPRLATALAGGVRTSGSTLQRRLLGGFVIVEMALSLALLSVAGLMVRSVIASESVPVNFAPDRTLTMEIPLEKTRYPDAESRVRFWREFLERGRNVPGVQAITVDSMLPSVDVSPTNVVIPGQPDGKRYAALHMTDEGYLAASKAQLAEGHFIDAREVLAQARDVVVSQNFVKRYFNGEHVIGRVIHLPDLMARGDFLLKDDAFTIVGVIQDIPYAANFREGENFPHIFVPYTLTPVSDMALVFTRVPAVELTKPMQDLVASIDKDQPVRDVLSFQQVLNMYGYSQTRFTLALFGSFAGAAFVLSLVGIYGVVSFITSQRSQEIGIRMAMGANRSRVLWMVLRQAALLSVGGAAVGLPLAWLAGQLAKDELVMTSQHDPLAMMAALCLLPLLAVLGAWLPALRASAVDPVRALRSE